MSLDIEELKTCTKHDIQAEFSEEKNVGFPVPHRYLLPSRAAVCFDPAYIIAQSHGYLYENSI